MIETLTPRQREVYAAASSPGARHAEVALALGMTPASLSVVLTRVRRRLGIAGEPGRPEIRAGRPVTVTGRCPACHLLLPCDHVEARAA